MPLTKVKSGGVSDSITLTSPDINAPDIDGGTIDNAVIGGSTAAAGTFTTITATGGSSSNWNTAYGWGDHSTQSYATQTYVGTAVSNLVDSSPAALDTLNELAAALGDDPNFATTVTNSIALKAPLASPSFTGTATMDGLVVGDNQWIYAGNGADLKIGHDGTDNIISAQGSPLYIDANGTTFRGYSPYTKHMDIATNGDISFYEDTGTTAKLFWDASAESLGIGGAATDGTFQVKGTGVNTGIPNVLIDASFADASNATGLTIGHRTDETTAVIAPRTATGNLAFYNYNGGWSESMRISSAGNVGIGLASPIDTKLVMEEVPATIVGGNAISGSTMKGIKLQTTLNGVESVGLWFGTNSGTHWSGISGQRTTNSAGTGVDGWATDLRFYTHESASADLAYARERMRIDGAGNVGIGTSSFNATYDPRLQVTSAASDGTGGVLIQNYLPTLTLEDISGGAAVSQIQQDQTNMLFKNNGAERMRIGSSGQVKIANGGSLNFDAAANGNYDIAYKASDNTFNIIANSSSAAMGFHTSSTERMRISSAGAISVGSSTQAVTEIQLNHENSGGKGEIQLNSHGTASFSMLSNFTGSTISGVPTGGFGLITPHNYRISISTNGLERMRISASGHIGVFGSGATNERGDIAMTSGTGVSTRRWGFGGGTGSNSSVFYIINEGNVGQYMAHGSQSWTSHSDERIKENITDVGTVLPSLMNMRCVKYNLISNPTDTKIGFIAQDWELAFPEVVDENEHLVLEADGTIGTDENSDSTTPVKAMAYTETLPLLLKAIQEQQTLIESLTARIAALEA